MNGRCLKKPAVSDFRAVLLLLHDLLKKEDTFGGRVPYSQTEEYFENGVNAYEWKKSLFCFSKSIPTSFV